MENKLYRAIKTEGNKSNEYIGLISGIPEKAIEKRIEPNHLFDWCVKKSFEKSPYFGSASLKNPKSQKFNNITTSKPRRH